MKKSALPTITKQIVALVGAGLFTSSVAVASPVVVVTPSNMDGWSFQTDGPGNTAQMVTGPGTPPLGVGSAQLATAPGQGDTSAQLYTDQYTGTLLSSLTSLSYYTYDTVNNGQQFPYLKLYLSNGDALYLEPPYQTPAAGGPSVVNQGATELNTWQSWNALEGSWWDDNGTLGTGGYDEVGTIATYLADNPDVTIDRIRFAVGYASAGDNFNGYVDDFTIGTAAGTTTYDFEPGSVPDSGTTLALLGFGLVGLGLLSRWKVAQRFQS